MAKYIHQNELVEVLTFDEFIEVGKILGANIVNDMPWSFEFHGYPVTHENDNWYIVGDMDFRRGDLITLDQYGDIGTISLKKFKDQYVIA